MKNPSRLVKETPKLGLPPVNTLLPKDLSLQPASPEHSKTPTMIKAWPGDTEVWYLKDDKFARPKAIINIKVYPHTGVLQELGISARGRMIAEVWVAAVKEHLREFMYMAQMASLELEFTVSHDGITMQFSGFNDSLVEFVTQTLTTLSTFSAAEPAYLNDLFN